MQKKMKKDVNSSKEVLIRKYSL